MKKDLKKRVAIPLSTDCVVFRPFEENLQVLLIQRKKPPFKGKWALPGGFLEGEETLEETAIRELQEETGVSDIYLKQFFTFSRPDRDPRGRVVSTAFYALITPSTQELKASADAAEAQWWPIGQIPPLAFDHYHIIQMGWDHLKRDLQIEPLIFEVIPRYFSLGSLQSVYECILGRTVDKRNFWKKVQNMPFILKTQKILKGKRRPATLYRFDQILYQSFLGQGIKFDL